MDSVKNALASLGGRPAPKKTDAGRDSEEFATYLAAENARFERNYNRVLKWALQQPKEHLAAALALSVVERSALRGAYRESKRYSSAARPLVEEAMKSIRDRRRGAAVKLARDPKQKAKAGALTLWLERHEGKHKKLRTVEQFATEVMRRWPVLESSKVIAKWSAGWTKDLREGRTPSI